MKKILIVPLMVLGVLAGSSVPFSTSVAHAQWYGMPGYENQYNLRFRLRDQDYHIRNYAQLQAFLEELIAYLRELTEDRDYGYAEVEVTTRSATDVTDDSAVLRGSVSDFDGSDFARVWFEYGRSYYALTERTDTEWLYEDDDADFEYEVDDLRTDTRYYFRAVARDEHGRSDYGSVLQFVTDDDYDDDDDDDDYDGDEPHATTRSASNIGDDYATLHGSVDMNDYDNGTVFFVYGEDESQVEDIEDDYDTYDDIDEDDEDLQKVRVETGFDGSESFELGVGALENDTRHYYSICVEYEDDDDDEVLTCGNVVSFTTDW